MFDKVNQVRCQSILFHSMSIIKWHSSKTSMKRKKDWMSAKVVTNTHKTLITITSILMERQLTSKIITTLRLYMTNLKFKILCFFRNIINQLMSIQPHASLKWIFLIQHHLRPLILISCNTIVQTWVTTFLSHNLQNKFVINKFIWQMILIIVWDLKPLHKNLILKKICDISIPSIWREHILKQLLWIVKWPC